MDISIIFSFLKNYYKEVIIGILTATLWIMHINNNILESELALSKQQVAQEQDKLTVSNSTIAQLQIQIDNQNNKLQELSDKSKERQESLKGQLEEAKLKVIVANQNLEEYINSKDGLTNDLCFDILNELSKIGE